LNIHTTGYAGKHATDLLALAERLDATVIDIRLVPSSRWQKQWRAGQLRELLGARYEHVRDLGNENYKLGGPVKIKDLDAGINKLLEIGGTLILLCVCSDPETCHRRVVARELEARGHQVSELESWNR
jgi:uncharacterized protein (DUF488 family)